MTLEAFQDGALMAFLASAEGLYRLLFSPTSRTFYPYLLPSLIVAVAIEWHQRRRADPASYPSTLFSRQTWLGRSAMSDYWLIVLNAAVLGYFLSSFTGSLFESLEQILPRKTIQGQSEFSGFLKALLVAAILFIADDFARFWLHWLEHRIGFLWEFHKVHHSAEQLNFLTAERHHPVSAVYYSIGFFMIAGLVNLLLINGLIGQVSPASLLGGNLFWIAANLLCSTLRHSPVWLSFGPRIERHLISPAQHQIHHSDDPRHFDRNFGSTLAVWDRLFGTLYLTTSRPEPIRFGLGEETRHYRSPWQLYWTPCLMAWRRVRGLFLLPSGFRRPR